jgi:ubiquinone/menaquinone biosynthesis C-methylase UbiE
MNHKIKEKPKRKQWFHLLFRIIYVYLTQQQSTSEIVTKGYDTHAHDYDIAWTNHMRDLSDYMIQQLPISKNATCLDLFCGTGYVTGKLADRCNGTIIGVDKSEGMLEVAKDKFGKKCQFIHDDALVFLKMQPDNSFDIITCAWALFYQKPEYIKLGWRVLKSVR